MNRLAKVAASSLVVIAAVGLVAYKYRDYIANPWTRNGQVRAIVIQVTPRVSGTIVGLPIKDNQFVAAGDLLFEIDRRTYQAALDKAAAKVDETRDDLLALEQEVKAAQAVIEQASSTIEEAESSVKSTRSEYVRTKADFARAAELLERGNVSKRRYDQAASNYEVARADLQKAISALNEARSAKLEAEANLARTKANLGASGDANARLRAAQAALEEARLNLEFTQVKAPVDGYVTNLNLRLGSQAVANQAALALVDVSSFWINGFFRETMVSAIRPGNKAVITLMGYPDKPIVGEVESLGWGIAQEDGSTSYELLPNISPTFEWIRLAQRVPVRIRLIDPPKDVQLRVGTTASVLVLTGEKAAAPAQAVPPAPKALQ